MSNAHIIGIDETPIDKPADYYAKRNKYEQKKVSKRKKAAQPISKRQKEKKTEKGSFIITRKLLRDRFRRKYGNKRLKQVWRMFKEEYGKDAKKHARNTPIPY